MEKMNRYRKVNLLLTIGIYLSLAGSVICIFMKWYKAIWLFLTLGIVFLAIRSISFIIERAGRFYQQD